MNSNLSAEDLTLISNHLGKMFGSKIDDVHESVAKSMTALQKVNEVNHVSLHKEIIDIKNKINEIQEKGEDTNKHVKITNGRVTKLENNIFGERDPNGNSIKGREGMAFYLEEIIKYRPLYKKIRTPFIIGGGFSLSIMALAYMGMNFEGFNEFIKFVIKLF